MKDDDNQTYAAMCTMHGLIDFILELSMHCLGKATIK